MTFVWAFTLNDRIVETLSSNPFESDEISIVSPLTVGIYADNARMVNGTGVSVFIYNPRPGDIAVKKFQNDFATIEAFSIALT